MRRRRVGGEYEGRERRSMPRPALPEGPLRARVEYLARRVEFLEQLLYGQVRRITALEAELDHLHAKRKH